MERLKEVLFQTVSEYFNTTTIHGFAYLLKSKSVIERLTWCIIIVSCMGFAGFLIQQALFESEEDPIATTVDLVSVKNVPYPAVTINSDPSINPWGFTEKMYNSLVFYGQEDALVQDKASALRQDFGFIMDKLVVDMIQTLQGWDPDSHKFALPKNLTMLKETLKSRFVSSYGTYQFIIQKAPVLAAVDYSAKGDYSSEIMNFKDELIAFTGDCLLNTLSYKMRKRFKELNTMIMTAFNSSNADQETIDWCQSESKGCMSNLVWAMTSLAAPFYINRMPFGHLGFGDYLSYFARLLRKRTELVFFEKDMDEEQEMLLQKMADAVSRMSRNQTFGLSSYEIVDFLTKSRYLIRHCSSSNGDMEMDKHIRMCYGNNWQNHSIQNCCQTLRQFDHDLETVLKIMRHSVQTPTYYEPLEDMERLFENFSFLGYETFDRSRPQFHHSVTLNRNCRIFMCNFEGKISKDQKFASKCELFHRSLTSGGLGFTFNQADFWSTMKPNVYTKAFAKILTPKGHDKKIVKESGSGLYEGKNIKFPTRSGQKGELLLVLQKNRLIPPNLALEMNPEKAGYLGVKPVENFFKIDLHDPLSLANMDDSIEIDTGTETIISITPYQITTSRDLESINEAKRNCRFSFENKDSKLFQIYRQDSCLLECRIKVAEMSCKCSSWQYPSLNTSLPICNGLDGCFEEALNDAVIEDKCFSMCPIDCNMMRYSKVSKSKPLNIKDICSKTQKEGSLEEALQDLLGNDHAYPPKFIRNYQQLTYDKDTGEDKICMENLENMAIVRLRIEDSLVQSIKRSRRVRITDHFSNIGKN